MTDVDLIASLSDRHVAALTVYGEASDQRRAGRVAVAWVLRNRLAAGRFGATLRDVCLRPWQFSCWTAKGGSANYQRVIDAARTIARSPLLAPSTVLAECVEVVDRVLANMEPDPTTGATHYQTVALAESPHPASWSIGEKPSARVGDHLFYKGIR